jgi:peptide/nickel transport system substrate-binding protein
LYSGKHRERSAIAILIMVTLVATLLVAAAPAAAEVKKYHGTVVSCQTDEPKTLNPCWSMDSGNEIAAAAIYSRLVSLDGGGVAYPDLADSWENTPDFKTFTFHLHKGVKWHDGTPFTSADVKFTYDTIIAKQYPGVAYLKNVEEISCPDDLTVVVKFSQANVAFVPMLALGGNWYLQILPKHYLGDEDWKSGPHINQPMGTGPFKFVEWVQGSHITMEANKDFFMGAPYVDKLVIRFIPDAQVAFQAFKSGELTHLPYDYVPPYKEIAELQKDPSMRVINGFWLYGSNLSFNTKKAPFGDPRVRRAIAMAIDRDAINRLAFNNTWTPSIWAGIPAVSEYLNKNATYPAYDVEAAKKLLDEAGLKANADGVRLECTITAPPYEYDHLICESVVEQLRQIGIKLTWNKYDWETWFTKLKAGDFDLSIDYMRYAPDPNNYYDLYHSQGSRNFKGIANAELDSLLEAGKVEIDIPKRHEIYNRVQEILVTEIADVVLFNQTHVELLQKNWHGSIYEEEAHNKALSWMGFYAFYRDAPEEGAAAGGSSTATLWYVIMGIAVVAVVLFFVLRKRGKK